MNKFKYTSQVTPKIETFEELRLHLMQTPRDLLLLDMLSLCCLPLSYLVGLQGDAIREENGKKYVYIMNKDDCGPVKILASGEVIESFELLKKCGEWNENGPMFLSRKGKGQLSLSGASRLVKNWENYITTEKSLAVSLRNKGKDGFNDSLKPTKKNRERSVLHGELYKRIFEAIITHKLAPGEQLRIDYICKSFGASQSPVREALQRLQALGFVTKSKNNIFVSPLSKKDFKDILESRVLLECKLAETAVEYISNATINRLERLHNKFVEQWKMYREGVFPEYDQRFHFMIYSKADKPILLQMAEWLWQRSYPYLHLIELAYIVEDSAPAHERILCSLKSRDTKAVVSAVKDNIIHGLEDLYDYIA